MPRIRTIKPDFWRSRTVARLSDRAALTFVALWTFADDEGRGIDDAAFLRADIWTPHPDVTDADVEAWMRELEAANLVVRYRANGRPLYQVRSWAEHQRVPKPSPSKYPPPEDDAEPTLFREPSDTVPIDVRHRSGGEVEVEVEVEVERETEVEGEGGSGGKGKGSADSEHVGAVRGPNPWSKP